MISATPTVAVLDYGSGNLRSVVRALGRTGAEVILTTDIDQAEAADGLVVPGVGSFATCMAGLLAAGGDELIRRRAAAGRPVLGICVGFQVLFSAGVEHGVHTPGVGVFSGDVTQLPAPRLPHMGWNTVQAGAGSQLFATGSGDESGGDADGERFYFVHSYGVCERPDEVDSTSGLPVVLSTSHHGASFVAGIESGAVSGTQFHPEKSADAGSRLLQRWLGQL